MMKLPRFSSCVCLTLLALTAGLAACGSAPVPINTYDGKCIGMADDLKTLKVGDELPRVIQVLGWPARSYRAYRFLFWPSYDVLEYDLGGSPCARAVLHVDKTLRVFFDSKGRYEGHGGEDDMGFRGFTTTGTEKLVIDPVIMRP